MNPTRKQLDRIQDDWSQDAKEGIHVEYIEGAYYGFGTELATLRLLKKYLKSGSQWGTDVRQAYSRNLSEEFGTANAWYFVLEPSLRQK